MACGAGGRVKRREMPDWLRVLLTPACWSQHCPYDERWDAALNDLLDRYEFRDFGHCTAMLGPVRMWIENHPYASMHPDRIRVRAKRATILRAGDQLDAAKRGDAADPLNGLLAQLEEHDDTLRAEIDRLIKSSRRVDT